MEKRFLVYDRSGRSSNPYNLTQPQIEQNWDLSEQDDTNEKLLGEFIKEAERGDTWQTDSLKIICSN